MGNNWIKSTSGILALIFCLGFSIKAQTPISDEIFFWNGPAPGSDSVDFEEVIDDRDPNGGLCHLNRTVKQVVNPSIKHFAPENPNGRAVLICPGGGYALLAYDKEGFDIAQWYIDRDITAFVLKYRLPIDDHENSAFVPLMDAQRAIRYIRGNAEQFNINPDSVGVMGGSAGGHLAASLSVLYDWKIYDPVDGFDSLSARPDFSVLMYPVISLQDSLTHGGSRTNLLGSGFRPSLRDSFSTELHVDSMSPPAFLFHARLDGSVKFRNSVVYSNTLTNFGVENSLNIYQAGGHGQGKCEAGRSDFSRWPNDLNQWLEEQGWTTPCQGEKPVISIVEGQKNMLSTRSGMNLQWYREGIPVIDATDSIFEPAIIGNYTVSVQGVREGSGSDCSLFSDEFQLDALSKIEYQKLDFIKLFPNPAQSRISIQNIPSEDTHIQFRIFNQTGSEVITRHKVAVHGNLNIDISGLPAGMYYLTILGEQYALKGKFVKQ